MNDLETILSTDAAKRQELATTEDSRLAGAQALQSKWRDRAVTQLIPALEPMREKLQAAGWTLSAYMREREHMLAVDIFRSDPKDWPKFRPSLQLQLSGADVQVTQRNPSAAAETYDMDFVTPDFVVRRVTGFMAEIALK
jgi:hypothetical protein